MKLFHIPHMESCHSQLPVTLKKLRSLVAKIAFHNLMMQRMKKKKRNIRMKHIGPHSCFSGKWGRNHCVRGSEGERVLFQWHLVGTLFPASSELNKAQKQIRGDLIGPKCFSTESLYRFGYWYTKYVENQVSMAKTMEACIPRFPSKTLLSSCWEIKKKLNFSFPSAAIHMKSREKGAGKQYVS